MRNPALYLRHAGLAGSLLLLPVLAAALDMDTAVDLAVERDEALKALERRVSSLSEQAVADGALPDPEILLGVEGVPVTDPFDADMMTMYKVGVRQRIPAGQTRSVNRQRTRAMADAVQAEYRARKLNVARQTRQSWLDWTAAAHSLDLARHNHEAFQELVEITEARYRAGTGRQRDINQARLELALFERRIIERQTELDDAASRLQRWTGLMPHHHTTVAFPSWPEPAPDHELKHRLLNHPTLQVDEQRIEVGIHDTRLARQAYRPTWMVEAGYAHQRGTDPMTMSRQSDKLFAMVTFSLPLFTGNRQDRQLAATRDELMALNHDQDLRLQELGGQLSQQLRRWQRNSQHLELIDDTVLAEAETTVDVTFSAYRADRATFDELVRARLALFEQQLARIDVERARHAAAIELAWLTAENLQ